MPSCLGPNSESIVGRPVPLRPPEGFSQAAPPLAQAEAPGRPRGLRPPSGMSFQWDQRRQNRSGGSHEGPSERLDRQGVQLIGLSVGAPAPCSYTINPGMPRQTAFLCLAGKRFSQAPSGPRKHRWLCPGSKHEKDGGPAARARRISRELPERTRFRWGAGPQGTARGPFPRPLRKRPRPIAHQGAAGFRW